MKTAKKLILMFFMACIAASPSFADDDAIGTTGGNFLKIDVGARSAGMAGAFTAISDDSSATCWNPAGLTRLEQAEVSSMYTNWLEGTYLANISGAAPLSSDSSIGASIMYLNMGAIKETTVAEPAGTGRTFTPYDLIATLSYARKFPRDISLGLSAKMINDNIYDGNSLAGVAFDFGMIYSMPFEKVIYSIPFKKLSVGAVVKNVGSLGSESPLPTSVRLGLAYKMLENEALTVALDANMPNDNAASLHLGAEYYLLDYFCLRCGVNTLTEEKGGGNIAAGTGFRWDGIGIDYAYAPYGDLGEAHMASINARF
jgi:hypothetical protein